MIIIVPILIIIIIIPETLFLFLGKNMFLPIFPRRWETGNRTVFENLYSKKYITKAQS